MYRGLILRQVEFHDKDFRSKTLIKEAILDNELLRHLSPAQVYCTVLYCTVLYCTVLY